MADAITAFGNLPFPHALLLTLVLFAVLVFAIAILAAVKK